MHLVGPKKRNAIQDLMMKHSDVEFTPRQGLLNVDLVDDTFAKKHPLLIVDDNNRNHTLLRGWETTATSSQWKSAYTFLLCVLATTGRYVESSPNDCYRRAQRFAKLASSEDGASFEDLRRILTFGNISQDLYLCTILLSSSKDPRLSPSEDASKSKLGKVFTSAQGISNRIKPWIYKAVERRRKSPTYQTKIFFWPRDNFFIKRSPSNSTAPELQTSDEVDLFSFEEPAMDFVF